jgi:hypothetical protein
MRRHLDSFTLADMVSRAAGVAPGTPALADEPDDEPDILAVPVAPVG